MIRPLRQRHHHTFVVMGCLLPVLFALGIVARKPYPSMESLPDELSGATPNFSVVEWQRSDLFAKSPVQVKLLGDSQRVGSFAVDFSTARDFFIQPDLIVYWVAGNPPISDKLPDAATLLGAFASRALPLPIEAATNSGVLVLYSLANHEIVDVSKPFWPGKSTD